MMKKQAKWILAFLLVLSILIVPKVYATEDTLDSNAEQGNGTGVSNQNNARKLWQKERQGYSLYVVDLQGSIISPVVNFWVEMPEGGDDEYISTIGERVWDSNGPIPNAMADIPPALVNRGGEFGVPNGDALREWINSDSKLKGVPNGEFLIWRCLGGWDNLKLFQAEQCKLVVEAIFWHYPNNVQGSRAEPISGTAKNIAQWTLSNPDYSTDYQGNHSEYGDAWIRTYLSNNAPHSLMLGYYDEDYKIGMPATSSGSVKMSEVIDPSQGYGLHIYKIGDFSEVTKTYDEVQRSPAPAPKMEPEITDTTVRDILRPVTIIKVYETTTIDQFGSKTTVADAVKYREHNCRNIQIMDEPEVGAGYTVTHWQESRDVTTPTSWKDVEKVSFIRKSTGSRTITTYPDTKVLYVHLEHINQVETKQTELILRESEITRAFMTQEVEDWGYQLVRYKWGDFGGTCSVNMGCQCDPCNCVTTDESGNEVGTCDCRDQCNKNYSVTDGTYNLLTKVGVSNNKVIPILDPFKALEQFGVYHSGTVNYTEAGQLEIPDYAAKFVIWRGEDIPTLAGFEDTSGSAVNVLVPVGSIPQAVRKNENYERPITLTIKPDPSNPDSDFELGAACPAHGDQNQKTTIEAENDLEYQGTAKIQVYSGEEKGLADEMPNPQKLKKSSSKDGYIVKSYTTWLNTQDEALTFYPVIAMSCQKPGNQPEQKEQVFILSQYLSEMKIASALKVEWQSNNTSLPYNVEVKSDQWASDVNATNGNGWKKAGFVLDGGFMYQLSTNTNGGASGSTITLTGYYPCIRDSQRSKVQSVDGKWTETNGRDEFNQLVNTTVERINAANLDQYLDTYSAKGTQTALNGIKVYPGASLGKEYGSSQCQTDSKYYLRDTEGTNSNHVRGSLTSNNAKVYDFCTDYKGNVYMNGAVILKQGDGIEKLPQNVKIIDDYTKVVTNLVGAVTRNKGNDQQAAWVTNGHWYNEQQPVISIICYTATITVDIADHDSKGGTQSILDPALCPKSIGTKDKYSAANITQFVINFENDIGTVFNGQKVSIPNSDNLLVSRYFYVPNVNAQQKD